MNKRKVIIDTDPGIDDLLAITLALNSKEIDVAAISTVFGNTGLENTTKNAKLICDLLGKKIPIIKGSKKPLFYERKRSSTVHGEDGLANLYHKYEDKTELDNQIDDNFSSLYHMINNSDEKITIIALGPLTNIARLLLIDKNIADKIEEIHIMGGGLESGNVNELAEFNFYSDSYAAKAVLTSDIPIVISTLDVTSKVYFTEDEMEKLPQDTVMQELVAKTIEFYTGLDPYLHDAVSILTLTHPELFEFTDVAMDVITSSTIADGLSYVLKDDEVNKNIKLTDTENRKEIIHYVLTTIFNKV